MKILLLVQSPNVRGPVPKHSAHLVTALEALGCEVTTALWGRHSDDEGLTRKIFGRLGDALRVRRLVRARAFDVMVVKTAHDWATLSRDLPLLFLTRRHCPRIVIQFHGSDPASLQADGRRIFKRATRRLLAMCDAAMVLSTEELEEWVAVERKRPFYVVANPYIPRARRDAGRLLDGASSTVPVILFVGRLVKGKGAVELLHAAARLKQTAKFHVHIVGDGALRPTVQATVEELGLSDETTLAGYLEGDSLAAAYEAADIFVLPTMLTEGFPTVLAEAMDAGLPIVTTKLRGAADYLKDEVNCLFVRPGNLEDLESALLRLLEDEGLRRALGEANQEAVRRFAPDAVAAGYLGVLKEVVNG